MLEVILIMTFETHNLASWIFEVFSQYSASLSNTVSCLHGLKGHSHDHRDHQRSEFTFVVNFEDPSLCISISISISSISSSSM